MRIKWNELNERFFERGVSRGVLYSPVAETYAKAAAWNGLTGVTENPSGAESNKQYADNSVYADITSNEEFGFDVEAFTYPPEFLFHDGVRKLSSGLLVTGQSRPYFGFHWRTEKGTAADEDLGYVLNFAYGCKAAPSGRSAVTTNDGVELQKFTWTVTTTPVSVIGLKPTSLFRVDSTDPDVSPAGLAALEDTLYGVDGTPGTVGRLPFPDEINTILNTATANPDAITDGLGGGV